MPSASHRLTAHPSSSNWNLRLEGQGHIQGGGSPCPNSWRDAFEQLLTCRLSLRTGFDEEPSESYPGPRCHFGDAAFLFWKLQIDESGREVKRRNQALKW